MTIKSLRDTLLNLPSQYDDREIWFCLRFEEDGSRVISFDEPICGSMLPDSTNTFLLLGEKAMDYMVDKNPQLEDGSGENWIKGSL
jgi:hypothetical protein